MSTFRSLSKPAKKARKKKRKPARRKGVGPSFEREVCRRLSLWHTAGERDDLFWRSSMSGGRATIRFKKGKSNFAQIGDVQAIDSLGEELTRKFVFECKNYGDLGIVSSLMKGHGKLRNFWGEACTEAATAGRHPVLIAKEVHTATLMLLSEEGAEAWGMENEGPLVILPWFDHGASLVHVYAFDDVVPTLKEWKE